MVRIVALALFIVLARESVYNGVLHCCSISLFTLHLSVDFNHFHILRAIGKGAFGKVTLQFTRYSKSTVCIKQYAVS